jgi:hypothetical protein
VKVKRRAEPAADDAQANFLRRIGRRRADAGDGRRESGGAGGAEEIAAGGHGYFVRGSLSKLIAIVPFAATTNPRSDTI